MLVIKIELWSAITGKKTELARMHICNTGEGDKEHGNYIGKTFRGRSKKQLDKMTVSRSGEISNWSRQRNNVWKLIAKMLNQMGY